MQRIRPIVVLLAILALLPSGSAVLASCFDGPSHSCCCDGDCPDDAVSVSRTMRCCGPGPATSMPPEAPAMQTVDPASTAVVTAMLPVLAVPVAAPVFRTAKASGVRPVPLFTLHAAFLI